MVVVVAAAAAAVVIFGGIFTTHTYKSILLDFICMQSYKYVCSPNGPKYVF